MEYFLLLLLGLLHLSQRCHFVSRDEDHKILSFLTSRDPSDSCWAVTSSPYSHNFFFVLMECHFRGHCLSWMVARVCGDPLKARHQHATFGLVDVEASLYMKKKCRLFEIMYFFSTHCLVFFLWHQGYLKKKKNKPVKERWAWKDPEMTPG